MHRRDLLSISDLSHEDLERIFRTASDMKADPHKYRNALEGRVAVLIFQKPSLRTRVTFEAGMTGMGGHAIYLSDMDISIGVRESEEDVARNLERWVDVIVARVFGHDIVTDLAAHAKIPVINALSDYEHPCQALADLFTLNERWQGFQGRRMVYVGDGNNVCHSLMLLCAMASLDLTVACPAGYEPDKAVTSAALALAKGSGCRLVITQDPIEAATGADAIYTDVWASMGQESEAVERAGIFTPYQLNMNLYKRMAPGALIMHCLPAHKGEEITEDVFEHGNSVVFDQAENRLHVQKAVLRLVLAP